MDRVRNLGYLASGRQRSAPARLRTTVDKILIKIDDTPIVRIMLLTEFSPRVAKMHLIAQGGKGDEEQGIRGPSWRRWASNKRPEIRVVTSIP